MAAPFKKSKKALINLFENLIKILTYSVLNGDRFSHDVNFTSINALIIRSDVTQLQTVIFSQAHSGIFSDYQISSTKYPVGLFPHYYKGVQVDHLTGQYYWVTLSGSKDLGQRKRTVIIQWDWNIGKTAPSCQMVHNLNCVQNLDKFFQISDSYPLFGPEFKRCSSTP